MITVKIDETTLLDLLVDRLEWWTDKKDIIELYKEYNNSLIESGCFEGEELDIYTLVDNDWVNYTRVITSDELKKEYNVDINNTDEDDYYDRVLLAIPEKDLYLVRTY